MRICLSESAGLQQNHRKRTKKEKTLSKTSSSKNTCKKTIGQTKTQPYWFDLVMWHLVSFLQERRYLNFNVNSLCCLAMERREFTDLILSVILSVVLVLFEKWLSLRERSQVMREAAKIDGCGWK